MSTRDRLISCAALLLAGASAAGCGGAGSHRSPQTTSAASTTTRSAAVEQVAFRADEPIARVGSVTITRGMLRRQVAYEYREQLGAPEPPDYAGCIEYLRSPGTPATTEAAERLKSACAKEYEELAQPALSSLLHEEWILGQGRAEGLTSAASASAARLESIVGGLTRQIEVKLERQANPVTGAQVADYYARHKASFLEPERRDLNIVRSPSKGAAERAKRELEDGASFAAVAAKSSLQQPPSSHNGVLSGVGPHQFGEPELSRAVFSAPLRTLRGPVETTLRFYVFEVAHRTSAHQRTLAEVAREIASRLSQSRRERVLSRYVAVFRRRWLARTSCRPGDVVRYCKQYPGSEAELREALTKL